MAAETATQKAQTTASDLVFSPFGNVDWIKSYSDAPANLYADCYRKALALAADRLQAQAAYLKSLSECTDPIEASKLNAEFTQQSASRLLEHGSKLFDCFRSGIAAAAPAK